MTLRFLKSWGYNGQIVRAGAVRSDITDFWATRFVAEGIAVEEKSQTAPPPQVEKKKTAPKKKK